MAAAIVRSEIALAEAAHGGAAAIKETLIDRQIERRALAPQVMNNPASRAESEQCLAIPALKRGPIRILRQSHARRLRLFTESNIITRSPGGADKLNVAPPSAGRYINGVVDHQPTWRHQWAFPQIESVSKPNGIYIVGGLTQENIFDVRTCNFDMPPGEGKAGFILLGNLPRKLKTPPQFELAVSVKVEGKCRDPRLERKLGVEKEWILPQYFPLVTALVNFHRSGQRTSVAKQVAIAILKTDDSANVRSVPERKTKFLAFGFFGRDL